jgi:hypothetical protein
VVGGEAVASRKPIGMLHPQFGRAKLGSEAYRIPFRSD